MVWRRKVVWSEGMFLRPQHFQQQERHFEALLQQRSHAAEPFYWGFAKLALDRELLAMGKVALRSAEGVLPDGTPFAIPQDDEAPAPLEVPHELKDVLISLALPLRRRSGVEVGFGGEDSALARYEAQVQEVADTNESGAQAAELQLAQARLVLRPAPELGGGWVGLPLVRVVERRADGSLLLDPAYIPTVLNNGDSSTLLSLCQELHGLLRQRGEALDARLSQPGRSGTGEFGDFLMLALINRWEPVVEHWTRVRTIHPERLFQELLRLVGELATFRRDSKRPPELPAYDHDDLQGCFAPLMLELRRGLSSVLEQNAIQIEIRERQYGVHVAIIPSVEMIESCEFVLAAQAQTSPEFLRSNFPAQVKMGPVERIRDLVNLHLPGVVMSPLPVAPRDIPYHGGFTYFQVDTGHDLWRQLNKSGGLALHVSGAFPELQLELWAIRRH